MKVAIAILIFGSANWVLAHPPNAPKKAPPAKNACSTLFDHVRLQCSRPPRPVADHKDLLSIVSEFTENHCWTEKEHAEEGPLVAAIEFERHRVNNGTSDPHSIVSTFLSDQYFYRRLVEEPGRANKEPFKPYTLSYGNSPFYKAILGAWEGTGFYLDDSVLKAIDEQPPLFASPMYPLENLCLSLPKHDNHYFRSRKAEALRLILALYFAKACKLNDCGNLNILGKQSREQFNQTLQKYVEADPSLTDYPKLRDGILAPVLFQHGKAAFVDHFVAPGLTDSRSGNLQQLKESADRYFNRLLHEASIPNRVAVARRGPPLISDHLSPNQTHELVLSGKCETGDDASYLPTIGRYEPNGEYKILPVPRLWYYEFQSGKDTKKEYNGFYDRKSIRYDDQSDTTRIILKALPDDIVSQKKDAPYVLRIKCEGQTREIEIKLDFSNAAKAGQVEANVKRSESPDYDAYDKDLVRKELFVSGANTRSAYVTASFLKENGYDCQSNPEPDLREAFYREIGGGTEKVKVDVFVKDAHANSDSNEKGVLRIDATGERYICHKAIVNQHGADITSEVVVLGAMKGASGEGAALTVDYPHFVESVLDPSRDAEMLFGSMSCASLHKCGFEISLFNSPKIQFIGTTSGCGMCGHAETDGGYGLIMGVANGFTYKQMEDKYPVFSREKIPLPHHEDYKPKMIEAVGLYTGNIIPDISEKPAKPDLISTAEEFLVTGRVTEALLNLPLTQLKDLEHEKYALLKKLLARRQALLEGHAHTVDPLVDRLILNSTGSSPAKARLIELLGDLNADPLAATLLAEALIREEDRGIRAGVAIALENKGLAGAYALSGALYDQDNKGHIWNSLSKTGRGALPLLQNLLKIDGLWGSPKPKAQLLEKIGPEGATVVLNLAHGVPVEWIPYLMKHEKGNPALKRILTNNLGTEGHTNESVEALRSMGMTDPEFLEVLKDKKEKRDSNWMGLAAALGPLAKDYIDDILKEARETNTSSTNQILAHIAKTGDPRILDYFVSELRKVDLSKESYKLFPHINGLISMGAAAKPALPEIMKLVARGGFTGPAGYQLALNAATLGEHAQKDYVELIASVPDGDQGYLIHFMSQFKAPAPEIKPFLESQFNSKDFERKKIVLGVLDQMELDDDLLLKKSLEFVQQNPMAVHEVANILGRVGVKEKARVGKLLVDAMNQAAAGDKIQIAVGLMGLGGEFQQIAQNTLHQISQEEGRLGELARRALDRTSTLKDLSTPDVIQKLESETYWEASEELRKRPEARPEVITALKHHSPIVRTQALEVLFSYGPGAGVKEVQKMMIQDPSEIIRIRAGGFLEGWRNWQTAPNTSNYISWGGSYEGWLNPYNLPTTGNPAH